MKILLYVPLWHRPEIVTLFMKNLENNPCPYAEVIPYFVISPEDDHYRALCKITEGYYKFEYKNDPFGRKKNEGLMKALDLEWDYVMEMNSDTLFTSLIWQIHEDYFTSGTAFFGLRNIYIYEPYLIKAVFVPGYHIGWKDEVTALGPGRCIRRDIVERCMPLWEDTAPFGMDGYSDNKISESGYDCTVIDNERLPVICDVKGNVCLTCWPQWEEVGEPVDASWVRQVFGLSTYFNLSSFENFHQAVLKMRNETRTQKEAFNYINQAYKLQTGEVRYASYESYVNVLSHKHRKL